MGSPDVLGLGPQLEGWGWKPGALLITGTMDLWERAWLFGLENAGDEVKGKFVPTWVQV